MRVGFGPRANATVRVGAMGSPRSAIHLLTTHAEAPKYPLASFDVVRPWTEEMRRKMGVDGAEDRTGRGAMRS